ncbi:hypothetical protein EW145_g5379 [Phellinidium pouzarii]|uniref:Uncharacterized protein n=1 Tax=Phellinidium pouzarii TaxID=167371 RepID=A0A4S4L0C9_9AGAM|nr:hypothetical protein EW145_g5379 [Phellinidium pouzarii]
MKNSHHKSHRKPTDLPFIPPPLSATDLEASQLSPELLLISINSLKMVWKVVKDTVRRLFGPDPCIPAKYNATFKDKEESLLAGLSEVNFTHHLQLYDFFPDFKIEVKDSDIKPTLATATNKKDIDNLFDPLCGMACNIVVDRTGNAKAMASANAEGIKTRDFAETLNNKELTRNQYNEYLDSAAPEIFDAHKKALQFHYMRILYSQGTFDLPSSTLTVEDVDRLFNIGFINQEMDFVIGRVMLGHGTLRRERRQTGQAMPDGKVLAPRARWTISANSAPPTIEEIIKFTYTTEYERFNSSEKSERGCKGSNEYQLPGALRPRLSKDWIMHHIKEYGEYGLKKLEMEDAAVYELIGKPDSTFIHPSLFEEYMKKPALFVLGRLGEGAAAAPKPVDDIAKRTAAAVVAHENAPAEPVDVPSSSIPAAPPSALFPPSVSRRSRAPKGKKRASPDDDELTSAPAMQCKRTTKRKKRAIPDEDDVTSDDGHHRRTRAHLSDVQYWIDTGIFSVSCPPSPSRVQRRQHSKPRTKPNKVSTTNAEAQGKKRAREGESGPSVEVEEGCSPIKKQKGASGSVAPAPATSSAVDAGRALQTAPGESHVTSSLLYARRRQMRTPYASTGLPVANLRRDRDNAGRLSARHASRARTSLWSRCVDGVSYALAWLLPGEAAKKPT